ncbi:hypothetical protein G7Z17_g1946 [Cylindrodendrum hubeiense]|uniref:Uncharacterized protein n=1 Tax=Cylindrodendrum hubeiense TaxID=595255 RepID=A0A9P5LJK0_9HYPO|nr:hypothetical protein G7Z17_g1946 [Cylindrodendrum hubeiense]
MANNIKCPLQQSDLTITPDAVEDVEVPLTPVYGDTYGEIRNEKNGLDTSAHVTDGCVNIRINQFNQRLSQLLTPALRQHVQCVQYSDSPPPPSPLNFFM